MIEYTYLGISTPILVRLNKKIVGKIKSVNGGYQYFPIGSKEGGELFKTITEIQKSLELDN